MDFVPRERLGIFLIIVSFWYLVNVKIFDALHPIFAIPGSLIFIAGLWLLLSLPTPAAKTNKYVPTEAPQQPITITTPKPVAKPKRKPTRKTTKKTRSPKSRA